MKLKKLDKYIIGKFMGSFFVALALLTLIVIIFDVSEKIENFVQKEAPLRAMFGKKQLPVSEALDKVVRRLRTRIETGGN